MGTEQSLSRQTDTSALSATDGGEQPLLRSGARPWRRWLLLLGIGVLVLAAVGWFGVLSPLRNPAAVSIPAELTELPLTGHAFGREAAEHIAHLHKKRFPLTGAAVGDYGNGQATLWVSRTLGRWGAQAQLRAMTDSIAEGTSPFTPTGQRDVKGCGIYALTGMGQTHFYFSVGDRVIWLAVAPDRADAALRELLDYFGTAGTGTKAC